MERFEEILKDNPEISSQYEKLNRQILDLIKSEEDAKRIWSLFQQGNNLHDYIKFFLIDHLQLHEELIEVLKSQNKRMILKALKCTWLFEKNQEILSPEYLDQNIFPFLSYSTRIKILHNLALFIKDEQLSKIFYLFLEETYDFEVALRFLPCCHVDFIKNIMNEKIIPPKVLLKIAKKDYETALFYFTIKKREKWIRGESYSPVISYIASKNLKLVLETHFKNIETLPQFTLNVTQTNFLFRHYFDLTIENMSKIKDLINIFDLKKLLNKDKLMKVIIALCPEKYSEFNFTSYNNYIRLMEKFPESEKFTLILYVLKEKYNIGLEEIQNQIDSFLLDKMPVEDRMKWVDILMNDEVRVDKKSLLKYYPTKVSIPRIKELLKESTNYRERLNLITSLVETCFLNNDYEELTQIISFIEERYRNDNPEVRITFLKELSNNDLTTKLNDTQWEIVFKFIKIYHIKEEFKYNSTCQQLLLVYLEYKYKNNQPIEELFLYLLKYMTHSNYFVSYWDMHFSDAELNYKCIELMIKMLPELVDLDSPDWNQNDYNVYRLISFMKKYNEKNPNKKFPLEDTWLFKKYLDFLYKGISYSMINELHHFKLDAKTKEELYEKILIKEPTPGLLNYFLKNDPQKLIINLNEIFNKLLIQRNLSKYLRFFRTICALGFLDLPNLLTNKCVDFLSSSNDEEKKAKAVLIICLLAPIDKVSEIIQPYLPRDSVLTTEENPEIYLLKKTFAKMLYKVQPFFELPFLIKFLEKDYLNLSLGSLYSICVNTPLIKTKPFLQENLKNRVSLRKHMMRLVLLVDTKSESIKMLNHLILIEKNSSLRGIIFEMVLRIFYNEPYQENYKMVLAILNQINSNDTENIKIFLKINQIPASYLNDYCSNVWRILKLNKFNPIEMEKIENLKMNFFRCIRPIRHFKHLKSDFIHAIINEVFLIQDHKNCDYFSDYLILGLQFILLSPDKSLVLDYIDKIFIYLKNLIDEKKKEKMRYFENRKLFLNYIQRLFSKTFRAIENKREYNKDVFEMMYKHLFDPELFFEERLYFELMKIFSEDYDIFQFGKRCKPLIQRSMGAEQHQNIELVLFPVIQSFISQLPVRGPEVTFCLGLLDNDNDEWSVTYQILAARILPIYLNKEETIYKDYINIINRLKKEKNVRMHLHKHQISKINSYVFSGWH